MLTIYRYDSVTVLHFSGGPAEAALLADAIDKMDPGAVSLAIPDPRDGERRGAQMARMVAARAEAEKLHGKEIRPLRAKVFDVLPEVVSTDTTNGPNVRPDPDEGAKEEQAEAVRLEGLAALDKVKALQEKPAEFPEEKEAPETLGDFEPEKLPDEDAPLEDETPPRGDPKGPGAVGGGVTVA